MSVLDFSNVEIKKDKDHTGHRTIVVGGKRFEIVEYEEDAYRPDWCRTGHVGFVVQGKIMYELEKGSMRIGAGSGFFIPPGVKHRGRNIYAGVTHFFLMDE